MKFFILSLALALFASVDSFAPVNNLPRVATSLNAKYNSMDEILALFPEEIPVLINFYDANTEDQIKVRIFGYVVKCTIFPTTDQGVLCHSDVSSHIAMLTF